MNICGDETIHIPQTECDDCEAIREELEKKQDKLTAGTGITIDENNVITSSGTTYKAGDGISIRADIISADMNTNNTYTKTDVDNLLAGKQGEIQAGDGLSFSGSTLNADRNPSNTYTKSEVDGLLPENVSELTNDARYQTYNNVVTLIQNELSNFDHLDYKIVTTLPPVGEQGVRYLIKNANDTYEELIYVDGQYYDIGSTATTGPVIIPIDPSPTPTTNGAIWFTTT